MRIKRLIKKELKRCGYKNIVYISIKQVYKSFRRKKVFYDFISEEGLTQNVLFTL